MLYYSALRRAPRGVRQLLYRVGALLLGCWAAGPCLDCAEEVAGCAVHPPSG